MSLHDETTPLLFTYNDASNICGALSKLRWAKSIVAVDGGSTDGTVEILQKDPRIRITSRAPVGFAQHCNFALSQITTPWALSVVADQELSDALIGELRGLQPAPEQTGFRARVVFCLCGRAVRAASCPPRVVLFRVAAARYENESHGAVIRLTGSVGDLREAIYQDDRQSLERWLTAEARRAAGEAYHLLHTRKDMLSKQDRVRLWGWPAPILVFFHVMIVRRGLLDGRVGWLYAFRRVLVELLVALELLCQRLPDNAIFVFSRPDVRGGNLEVGRSNYTAESEVVVWTGAQMTTKPGTDKKR